MSTFTKSGIGLLSMLILISCYSCSNITTYEEAMEQNRKRIEEPARLEDAQFLVEMKSLNMFQLELLKIASDSGYSSEIVNLGKESTPTFNSMSDDLTDVAKKEKFRLPTEMSPDHTSRMKAVKQTPRQKIDQQIIAEMRVSNEKALQRLTGVATEGSDPDVRAFAARKIGALRSHQLQVKMVEDRLMTTVKGN